LKGDGALKIGEFSKKFNVSADTVRYYISLSLLNPDKVHNQYHFDKSCENTMEGILELKELNFSIVEIQKIMSIKRLKPFHSLNDKDLIEDILSNKRKQIIEEIEERNKSLKILDEKLDILRHNISIDKKVKASKIGFPLLFLNNMSCPECQKGLQLNSENIQNNYVFKGKLFCDCGYIADIEDGILKIEDYFDKNLEYDFDFENNYHKTATPVLTGIIEKTFNWMKNNFNNFDFNNKVFLDINDVNGQFFSYYIENIQFTNSYFVINSLNFDYLKHIKIFLEEKNLKNIVLIAGDCQSIPLKENIIDYVIDMLGSNSYINKYGQYPIGKIDRILKENSEIFTFLIHLEKNSQTLKSIPLERRILYDIDSIKEMFLNLNFEITEQRNFGEMSEFGSHIHGAKEGDTVYFTAMRLKK